MSTDDETVVVPVAFIEELRERARAWRLEAERLQAERVDEGQCLRAAVDLLERIVKYAHEDRAQTPGFTRLEKVLAQTSTFLGQVYTVRKVQCDYPASWCAYPGCEKCASNHPRKPPPPLGVMPERVWDELHPNPSVEETKQRAQDLFAASLRYSVAGLDEPWQWHEEYLRRIKK